MIAIPLSEFIRGIHDVGAQRDRDAAMVWALAREVQQFCAGTGLPEDDPDIAGLLSSARAAERVAERLVRERPVPLNSLIRQPGLPTTAGVPA